MKGRTKGERGAWYGARLVPSRISHQIFFFTTSTSLQDFNFPHDFNFATQRQLFSTTSTFFHDFSTNSTFLHHFNLFHDFQFFHDCNFFYDCNTSTFQQDLNIAMSKWIWTPPPPSVANAYELRNVTCVVIVKNIAIIQNRQTAKKFN